MSPTPVDKPPDAADGSGKARSGRPTSLRGRIEELLVGFVDRIGAVRSRLERRDERFRGGPPTIRHATYPSTRAEREHGHVRFEGYPDREYPLTYPGRDLHGINTPDVVSVETDRGLRITVPENPDAELTSDVWTTVEP